MQYPKRSHLVKVFPGQSEPVKSGRGDCSLQCEEIMKNQVDATEEINKAPTADPKAMEVYELSEFGILLLKKFSVR